jgi:hypothetical protein
MVDGLVGRWRMKVPIDLGERPVIKKVNYA